MDKEIASKDFLLFILNCLEDDQKFDDHLGAILGDRITEVYEDRNHLSQFVHSCISVSYGN